MPITAPHHPNIRRKKTQWFNAGLVTLSSHAQGGEAQGLDARLTAPSAPESGWSALIANSISTCLGIRVAVAVRTSLVSRSTDGLTGSVPSIAIGCRAIVMGGVPVSLTGLTPTASGIWIGTLDLRRIAVPLDVIRISRVVGAGLVGITAITGCKARPGCK